MFTYSAPATVSKHLAVYQRATLKRHFIQVPHQLITDYDNLSDGAKLTYQALLTFDYVDSKSGQHKGIVNPSIETLVLMRKKSRSAIYAHLAELEQVGLIKILPGLGYRLYNATQGESDACQATSLPIADAVAIEGDRAPKVSPVDNHSTLTFQKSGQGIYEREEKEKENKQLQSPKIEEKLVVSKLEKLGFDNFLAKQFVERYGSLRVEQQITHLCRQLHSGTTIRSFPRWLYRAIERDYQNPVAQVAKPARPKIRRHLGKLQRCESGEEVYIVYEEAGE